MCVFLCPKWSLNHSLNAHSICSRYNWMLRWVAYTSMYWAFLCQSHLCQRLPGTMAKCALNLRTRIASCHLCCLIRHVAKVIRNWLWFRCGDCQLRTITSPLSVDGSALSHTWFYGRLGNQCDPRVRNWISWLVEVIVWRDFFVMSPSKNFFYFYYISSRWFSSHHMKDTFNSCLHWLRHCICQPINTSTYLWWGNS